MTDILDRPIAWRTINAAFANVRRWLNRHDAEIAELKRAAAPKPDGVAGPEFARECAALFGARIGRGVTP